MTNSPPIDLGPQQFEDAKALWDYHQMGHKLRRTDIAIGLGSHDLGVATYAAELYVAGFFPTIVFTGANAPTTIERFPRGEAVHYREHALELGVPDAAILIETAARNTGENFTLTKELLDSKGITINSAMVISRPYQQRRAYATAAKLWPEIEVVCASQNLPLSEYIATIGDAKRVVDMLVGDTQRIWVHAEYGYAIPQVVPSVVLAAYDRLREAGFTSRLLREDG